MITAFFTAHPYWSAYIVIAIPIIVAAIVVLFGRRAYSPAPDVSDLLFEADKLLADYAKTGRLRGPGGRFISTKDAR